MRDLRPSSELLVAGLVLICGTMVQTGCATLIGAAIDPVGTAETTAAQSLNSLTQVDAGQLANSSTDDLDRILAEHPNAENADQLKNLRGELANQPGVKGVQHDDLPREYRSQHDRRLAQRKRLFSDSTVVAPMPKHEDIPTGMRDQATIHPHGVDAPPDEGPAYMMETTQLRFGR